MTNNENRCFKRLVRSLKEEEFLVWSLGAGIQPRQVKVRYNQMFNAYRLGKFTTPHIDQEKFMKYFAFLSTANIIQIEQLPISGYDPIPYYHNFFSLKESCVKTEEQRKYLDRVNLFIERLWGKCVHVVQEFDGYDLFISYKSCKDNKSVDLFIEVGTLSSFDRKLHQFLQGSSNETFFVLYPNVDGKVYFIHKNVDSKYFGITLFDTDYEKEIIRYRNEINEVILSKTENNKQHQISLF